MKKKHILLLLVVLLLALAIPGSATQYNPPWAHNYGFLYPDGLDTRAYATYATNQQYAVGYNSFNLPDSRAYTSFNNIQDDAVFFFVGHGAIQQNGQKGARLVFFNGTMNSSLLAENRGFYPSEGDYYFLSSTTTELQDCLLALYLACYSGRTSSYYGNLVDKSSQKGIDNVIGFTDTIWDPPMDYWSERFWYRCRNHQRFGQASAGASLDVFLKEGSFWGFDSLYARYPPSSGYLDPARYGVV